MNPTAWPNGPLVVVPDTSAISRTEWLEHRRSGIGGSDVSAICGLNPYRSAFATWLDKTGQGVDEDNATEAMRMGHRLEPFVADMFAEEHADLVVVDRPQLLASAKTPWKLSNIDRQLFPAAQSVSDRRPKALLECKTVGRWYVDRWEDGPPDPAMLQTMHYLDVAGLDEAYVAALLAGQQFRDFRVERDDDLIAHLDVILSDFWDRVINLDPPDPDGSESTTDLLAHLWDVETGKVADLTADAARVAVYIHQIEDAREAEKVAKLMKAEAQNGLKVLLQDAEVGAVAGRPVVTWKPQTNRTFSASFQLAPDPDDRGKFSSVGARPLVIKKGHDL